MSIKYLSNLRRAPLAGLGIALSLGVIGCGDKDSYQTNREPYNVSPVSSQVTQQEAKLPTLEDKMKKTLKDQLNIDASGFEMTHPMVYGTESFPFPGYVAGTYYALIDRETDFRYFFSRRGEFIGRVRSSGEEKVWFSEQFDGERVAWREKYRKTPYGRDVFFSETINDDGSIIRSFDNKLKVYKVTRDGRFVRDRDYSGSFGGDGTHNLPDRPVGRYFVVHAVQMDVNGNVVKESGEFFPTNEWDSDYACAVRDLKTNKLGLCGLDDGVPITYIQVSSSYTDVFLDVVPRNIRSVSEEDIRKFKEDFHESE